MELADLLADVAERYDRMGMPFWPDPHPGLASPREEEYSRVTDGGRYGIVHARARAWTETLRELLGAEAEPDGRTTTLVSPRRRTLPLLLIEEHVALTAEEDHLPLLRVAVVDPTWEVDREPDCGCDACDSGSDDLLEAIDHAVTNVIGGTFVAMRGAGWSAQWYPDGGRSSISGGSMGDFGDPVDLCRRVAARERVELPPGTEVVVGRSWLG
ncbi:hypothetical protein SAMN04487968_107105 [Nocardioides terrae]|uniref:Uncharacterized protein n=1 Tax=Nocardioides terrae TaxID=574651 RepID=A0A1I1JQR0_9ACTN|nr:DUF6226 family protein [Nocardioides terrae]SFC50735.1 hypothetical protein SAMN04487968_107105 [Nocardioides terrae]